MEEIGAGLQARWQRTATVSWTACLLLAFSPLSGSKGRRSEFEDLLSDMMSPSPFVRCRMSTTSSRAGCQKGPVHLHIDAGATMPDYHFTDSAGNAWSGDTFYIGVALLESSAVGTSYTT